MRNDSHSLTSETIPKTDLVLVRVLLSRLRRKRRARSSTGSHGGSENGYGWGDPLRVMRYLRPRGQEVQNQQFPCPEFV